MGMKICVDCDNQCDSEDSETCPNCGGNRFEMRESAGELLEDVGRLLRE